MYVCMYVVNGSFPPLSSKRRFTAKSFRVLFMKGISEYQRYEFVVAPPFEFVLGFSSPTTFLNVDDILVNRSVSLIC